MSEKKLLDDSGYVVTTHRLIHPKGTIPMQSIRMASDCTDYPWIGTLIIAGISVPGFNENLLLGLGLLVAAGLFWKSTTTRQLLITTSGEGEWIKFAYKDKALLKEVNEAVNRAVELQRSEAASNLRSDLDSLEVV